MPLLWFVAWNKTGAVDVLVEAMRRPGGVGIIFRRKRLHGKLEAFAAQGELRGGGCGFSMGRVGIVGHRRVQRQ